MPARIWPWIAAAVGPLAWAIDLILIATGAGPHGLDRELPVAIAAAAAMIAALGVVFGRRELAAARYEPSRHVYARMRSIGRAAVGFGAMSIALALALAVTVVAIVPAG